MLNYKKYQRFSKSAGPSVPRGYQCAFNSSQYANNGAIALKKIEIDIKIAEKDPNTSKLYVASLYVYKGQVSGNFGQYLRDCANIDITITTYAGIRLQNISDRTPDFLDKLCQQGSGINSWYSGETDESEGGGMGGCSCKTGFRFEHGNYGKCIPVSTKTNDQLCQDGYGQNSNWDGTKTSDGNLQCGCQSGYQWNDQQKQCVVIPIKSDKQTCVEKYDENWDGFRDAEGRLQCACKSDYQFDITSGKCAIVQVKSNQQTCAESYGANSIWTGEKMIKTDQFAGASMGISGIKDKHNALMCQKKK